MPSTKPKIALALCDALFADEMEKTMAPAPDLQRIVYWGDGAPDSLESADAQARLRPLRQPATPRATTSA